VYAIERP
jgi:hypothetical protein